jgi:4-aminobutyrate aminotransferase-like enzyme
MVKDLIYSNKELLKLSKKYIIDCMGDEPLVFVEGKGVKVKDVEGKEYFDAISAVWVLNLGYGHPAIINAAKEQIEKIEFVSPEFKSLPRILLAKKLVEIAPGNLKKVLFAVSGGGAVEGAMHLAMRQTGGSDFITLYHGFHGRTFATYALSYTYPRMLEEGGKKGLERYLIKQIRIPNFYCYRCYFNLEYPECGLFCAEFLENAIEHSADSKIAGVIIEPVQANGGMIPSPDGYLQKVQKICQQHDIPLIIDEVQTAFCRCGKMWASELYEISPDLLVMGKALGGGFPLAGVLATEEYSKLAGWEYGFTTLGHPVACAASLAMINVMIEEKLAENAEKMGKIITKRIKEMAEKYSIIGDVRGPGLMIGVELVKNLKTKEPACEETDYFIKTGYKKGIIFGKSGPVFGPYGNVIKIKPAVNITEDQVEHMLKLFEDVLKETCQHFNYS